MTSKRNTYFPQVPQKYLCNGVPLNVFGSKYIFKYSSPIISIFEFSIMRLLATAMVLVSDGASLLEEWRNGERRKICRE
jgi:hypothetical protein